jgi:hypothetical protein
MLETWNAVSWFSASAWPEISAPGPLTGAWLVSYDPEGNDGHGDALWTHDPAGATVFTGDEWTALSRAVPANRPLRPDGKPNRPLTAFTTLSTPVDRPARPRPPVPEPAPAEPVSLAEELRAMGLM